MGSVDTEYEGYVSPTLQPPQHPDSTGLWQKDPVFTHGGWGGVWIDFSWVGVSHFFPTGSPPGPPEYGHTTPSNPTL